LAVKKGDTISIVGAGGKTSFMYTMAKEMVEPGASSDLRVLCTTTTHMEEPSLPRDCDTQIASGADFSACLERVREVVRPGKRTLLYSHAEQEKEKKTESSPTATTTKGSGSSSARVVGIPLDWPQKLIDADAADVVIVEADGSRRLPLKAPAPHEPALPTSTDVVVAVAGVGVVGEKLGVLEVFRSELVSKVGGIAVGETVTPAVVGTNRAFATHTHTHTHMHT